ncbi:MAG: 16S rRNA (guanine(527)-N(7))-methyltransferase RsmG [Sphingomonas sp.]|uniref:16S rRNA (guanine(527)-N(7))-methyltransferase RsmG n=1 Tax=Sphingomonas sp. TaxID=28214 RepID=UPI001AC478ED|nr:16S rRNA (guanine(527)-N(7))-methyltransferase RsmG [Sphingomonas sp.]MBN8809043.1 16S rRNA (guanine(527)-N(7))-methyltransferase RsmG [Sphingomonas sp.]
MTEEEARDWVANHFDPATVRRLAALADLVVAANAQQNLIAPSTVDQIWSRHIVDSLQLLHLAQPGRWLDVGTGAGFPGLVIAAAEPDREVVMIEPRRLRVDHLRQCSEVLDLRVASVIHGKADTQSIISAVISARAVATLASVFGMAKGCADLSTAWLLPKGRNAESELAEARRKWHGVFHVEQSITSPDSSIIVAREVKAR